MLKASIEFVPDFPHERYRDDFAPLVEGCGCYCCTHHQRAYVHHLLVTNELLAGVLLMLHNTTQLQRLLQCPPGSAGQRQAGSSSRRGPSGGEGLSRPQKAKEQS
ncbi:hypothetical protein CRUP_030246 [Coryphaenoides rupestris]|nr:hypothetical protein CRUP_030246 [Coryphaenoides rupestris]